MVKKHLLEEEEKEEKLLRFNLMKSKIVCLSKNNEFKEILRGKKKSNKYFTNQTACLGFIYVVRDPRDVAISYTHHCRGDLNVAIETML